MKILLVTEKTETRKHILYHLEPLGFAIIQYWNPLKAIDNLDEISPDLILMNAADFPRHWKTMLRIVRNKQAKNEVVFILMTQKDFPYDEAAKATHLGVNGIISEDINNRPELKRLIDLLKRYKTIHDLRIAHRYIPQEGDRFELIFTHPTSLQLVTGKIMDISETGARFKPNKPQLVLNLEPDTQIQKASLRIGKSIMTTDFTIKWNNGMVGIEFTHFSNESRQILQQYIDRHSANELTNLLDEHAIHSKS